MLAIQSLKCIFAVFAKKLPYVKSCWQKRSVQIKYVMLFTGLK